MNPNGCISPGAITWIIFISMIVGAEIGCLVSTLLTCTKKTTKLPMPVEDLYILDNTPKLVSKNITINDLGEIEVDPRLKGLPKTPWGEG